MTAIRVCNFTWPPEVPFGPYGSDCKLYTFFPASGCAHNCAYCWSRSLYERLERERKFEGRPWEQVELLQDRLDALKDEIFQKKYHREWMLLANRGDFLCCNELRQVFRGVLATVVDSGMRAVVLTKGILPKSTKRWFEGHQRLLDALHDATAPIWWGASLSTMDEERARVLEPGAPPPELRLWQLQDIARYSRKHLREDEGIKTWVSIGGWHRHSNIIELLKSFCPGGGYRPDLIILELLHKQSLVPFEDKKENKEFWDDLLVHPDEWRGQIVEVLQEALDLGLKLALKDELREFVRTFAPVRRLYEEIWGNKVFEDPISDDTAVQGSLDEWLTGG